MDNQAKTAILATGGTFDKEYDELTGCLSFQSTHLSDMLQMGRSRLKVRVQEVMMKDSLDITEDDREHILNACEACAESRIVITHGTDTMEDTARFLDGKLSGKTIVLTGAMIPYTFGSSDGLFNIGSALAFVQTLPPGVYVSMNGEFFQAQEVVKDRKQGIFCRRHPEQ